MSELKDFVIENGVLKKYVGEGGIVEIPEGIISIGRNAFSDRKDVTGMIIPEELIDEFVKAGNIFGLYSYSKDIIIKKKGKDIIHTICVYKQIMYSSNNWEIKEDVLLPIKEEHILNYDKLLAFGRLEGFQIAEEHRIKAMVLRFKQTNGALNNDIKEKWAGFLSDKAAKVIKLAKKINDSSYISAAIAMGMVNAKNKDEVLGLLQKSKIEGIQSILADWENIKTSIKTEEKQIKSCNLSDFKIEKDVLKKYVGDGGDVVIPDSVKKIDVFAFKGCKKLNSVVIGKKVERICEGAFANCVNLESVTMSESVIRIGKEAFLGCKKLLSFDIPKNVTHLGESNGASMYGENRGVFSGCKSLKKLVVPSNVKKVFYSAFAYCKDIDVIELQCSAWALFEGCFLENEDKIKKILVPAEYSDNLTQWWKARFPEEWLPIIALDNFDENATLTKYILKDIVELAKMLIECDRIDLLEKALDFSKKCSPELVDQLIALAVKLKNTSASASLIEYKKGRYTLNDIEEFEQDKYQKAIGEKKMTVSDWKKIYKYKAEDGGITITKYIGEDDVAIIPSSIGKSEVKRISSEAFVNCDQLIKIVIPDSVDIIDTTFLGCDSLTDIEVDENNKNYKSIEGNLYTKDGKALIRYALGKMDASYIVPQGVEIIRSDAFKYCKNLTMVTIPNSVHTIEIGLVIGGPFYEANIGLTIYGGSGSTAEKFAKKNRINFKEI